MSHIIGHGRYARESYPASPNVGVSPLELIRIYGNMQNGQPAPGTTAAPSAWAGIESVLVATNPPGAPQELTFLIPMPPLTKLGNATLVVFKDETGGAITGDTAIAIQWRVLKGATPGAPPVFTFPGNPIGASRDFFIPSAIPAPPNSLGASFDFSDVIVPAEGSLIYADLNIPADLVIPVDSSLEFFLQVSAP
jgi:hypothetical protein